MRNVLVLLGYVIIFLTGAAGLVYQVAWQKYAARLFGADSIATAIILATFLGGLSLGYFLCGKFSTRIRSHLRAFALLEGAIGVWCLAFPAIFGAVDSLTRNWSFTSPFAIIFQGLLCMAVLMGIPTICMGGTVPLMTRGISQNLHEATKVHARIYSINTAGAVLGALLAAFYLIPTYGLAGTMTRTSLVNLGACIAFLIISIRIKSHVSETATAAERGDTPASAGKFPAYILYIVAFTSGFYVMLLENVLIRFSNFALGSSSYTFAMIVAVFILAIAIGSFIVGILSRISASLLFWNQLLITSLLILVYLSLDSWPYWAHVIRIGFQPNDSGFWHFYSHIFLSLTAILILPVGCMGATIPIAFHELKRNINTVGRHSGLLLSWNTIGNLTGSIIGGIVFYHFMNNERIFLFAVLLAACSTCLVARSLARVYLFSGGALAAGAICLLVFAPFYDQNHFMLGTFRERRPMPYSLNGPSTFFKKYASGSKLLFYDDDPVSAVGVMESVVKSPFKQNALAIIVNGKSDSSTILDTYTLKLAAHLPALLAKSRKEVLVIGLGTGVTAGELTLYPDTEHIDVAEISPAVIKALPYFKDFTRAVHENPKLRLHQGDAFRILGRSEKKWDIIISEPSNPWVTGVDLLFTREFYAMVKNHLTAGGVFLQWVQQYDSSEEMLGMIFNTLQREFPETRIFWPSADDLLIVASLSPLTSKDVERAEAVLQQNDSVRESLGMIKLTSLDSLLLREVWTPSFVARMFSHYDLQTMDHPRLHYMAGKNFFLGGSMSNAKILDSTSVPFVPEYLLAMKYPDWKTHAFSREEYFPLAVSLGSVIDNTMAPMTNSLTVKTFLSNPDRYKISYQRFQQMGLDVLQFVVTPDQGKLDWGSINLQDAGFRRKAQALLDHVAKTRNWIVPYPVDGLAALLRQGISESRDPHERTWCALQLSLLLGQEKGNRRLIQDVLDKAMRENGGKLMVAEPDRPLLERVKGMMESLP